MLNTRTFGGIKNVNSDYHNFTLYSTLLAIAAIALVPAYTGVTLIFLHLYFFVIPGSPNAGIILEYKALVIDHHGSSLIKSVRISLIVEKRINYFQNTRLVQNKKINRLLVSSLLAMDYYFFESLNVNLMRCILSLLMK